MKVIVYSDYVCPFCFLELPALERLQREEGVELDYRAFELRPDPVPTLDPTGDYLTTTWSRSVYPMAERMGVPIKLPPVQPRSRMAFEGAEFARDAGKLDAYTRAVHEAFFQQGRDIGREDVLVDIARQLQLDGDNLRKSLRDHRYLPRVLEQEREAQELGINSVPSMVIGNCLVPGAVPYETLKKLVDQVRQSVPATSA
ncbi:MAG TPA: DsbA family oxidoreductase [Tepidisphaeraceae bacterium]|nr:DsbA family oxidoreductase [Tepidisphaeraceae bacterium]